MTFTETYRLAAPRVLLTCRSGLCAADMAVDDIIVAALALKVGRELD